MIKISKCPSIVQRSNKHYKRQTISSYYDILSRRSFRYKYKYNNICHVYDLFFDPHPCNNYSGTLFTITNIFSNIRMTIEVEGYTIKDEIEFDYDPFHIIKGRSKV